MVQLKKEIYLENQNTRLFALFQPKLKIIDAGHNSISKLDHLDHLKEIEDLWVCIIFLPYDMYLTRNFQLNNNKISSWSEVEKLAKLPALETVYLEQNPIEADDRTGYRRKAILALPQVSQIDATVCR